MTPEFVWGVVACVAIAGVWVHIIGPAFVLGFRVLRKWWRQ